MVTVRRPSSVSARRFLPSQSTVIRAPLIPIFSGYDDEIGEGPGPGLNANIPLPEDSDGVQHRVAFEAACNRIRKFDPRYLMLSLGLDMANTDPTGSWALGAKGFLKTAAWLG
ncbi:MAG: hypothetical protein L0Y67_02510 [Gammaproteobacteria bacterium]|nr:hypothetical protein [Gammaproteobacteria bacterium]MCI0590470.1 hypothetical protein [Gammaproteobacteria bacterium]